MLLQACLEAENVIVGPGLMGEEQHEIGGSFTRQGHRYDGGGHM